MSRELSSLYICYFPVTEPLVQTQVVAYLEGLASCGHRIHLLTFETENLSNEKKRDWRRRLKARGITWHHLRYHKTPTIPGTAYDVLTGTSAALKIIRRHRIDLVHARSHVPASMGLMLKKLTGVRLLFDIRGLLAEEYVDNGNWQEDSLPFRVTKDAERRCIEAADGIVVLTNAVKRWLFANTTDKPVYVIPCCADLSHIEHQQERRGEMREKLGIAERTVMVYVGKFGGWYMQQEMVDFFAAARKVIPNLFFLVLSQSDHKLIQEAFDRHGIPAGDYSVSKTDAQNIGAYLAASDFALSFIAASPSKIASSPTKMGEYMAAGLPTVCNKGVGDVDEIITSDNLGVLIDDFTPEAYTDAARRIMPFIGDEAARLRCRNGAQQYASLQQIGIPRYDALYREIGRNAAQAK